MMKESRSSFEFGKVMSEYHEKLKHYVKRGVLGVDQNPDEWLWKLFATEISKAREDGAIEGFEKTLVHIFDNFNIESVDKKSKTARISLTVSEELLGAVGIELDKLSLKSKE